MRRDPGALTGREFDVVVIGGGITGACIAWDAALRGLSVALLERGDFGQAASANSLKIVHGGIRYLQHLDLPRVRASVAERSMLLRIAPHLVEPLPFAIPLYDAGALEKAYLAAGLKAYDLLSADRNRGLNDPARRVPPGRLLSGEEARSLLPEVEPTGLDGAAVFHDGLMYNPPRLTLAFIRGAAELGAGVVNYVEATGLLRESGRVRGVEALDRIGSDRFDVRGRAVVNACGGWAPGLLADAGLALQARPTFSRDACFIIDRRLDGGHAIALLSKTRDPDAIVSRGARHIFLVPWRDRTLVGVWHRVYRDDPESYGITEEELEAFLSEVNGLGLRARVARHEVRQTCCGLVLFGENRPGARDLRYGKRSLLIDHGERQGVNGLITAIAVRYTVGRRLAERVVDRIVRRLGVRAAPCRTAETVLPGGAVRMEELSRDIQASAPRALSDRARVALGRNHGAEWRAVLEHASSDPGLLEILGHTAVTGAEVLHAVREESAVTLEDVVLRRTEMGSAGHPGPAALERAGELMAAELGWDPERLAREIEAVERGYPAGP